MSYAIIQSGGKQFRVSEGEVVLVPSLSAEVGDSVDFDTLIHSNDDNVQVGAPVLDGRVSGTVVEHGRGKKIIVFKMKRRKQYKKTHGHRQNYTAVKIESLG